eukprot:m.222466 g.222466  ORF g.222466 m.222466 type:complete len:66 (-) comp26329_c0_seq25:4369-4566(-)
MSMNLLFEAVVVIPVFSIVVTATYLLITWTLLLAAGLARRRSWCGVLSTVVGIHSFKCFHAAFVV